jgi:hypothetical protein
MRLRERCAGAGRPMRARQRRRSRPGSRPFRLSISKAAESRAGDREAGRCIGCVCIGIASRRNRLRMRDDAIGRNFLT